MSGFTARLGERRNTSVYDSASWLLALVVLAVVIPANDKIAANEVFFSAHGVSKTSWVLVFAVVLVVLWLLLAGVLAVLKKRASSAVCRTKESFARDVARVPRISCQQA